MQINEDGEQLLSICKPRPQYHGWINSLLGGIQAVLMDEICAWVILRKLQTTGVTSKMETRYRKSVSTTDSHIVLRASIKEVKRNIVIIEAKLYNKYVPKRFVRTLRFRTKSRKMKCTLISVM